MWWISNKIFSVYTKRIICSFVKLVNSEKYKEDMEKYVSREVVFKLYSMNLKKE